jgi:hypothetical protein
MRWVVLYGIDTSIRVLGVAGSMVLHDDTSTGVLGEAGRVVLHDDISISFGSGRKGGPT